MAAKLILKTFGGTMEQARVMPAWKESRVEFRIRYYGERDVKSDAMIVFRQVISIDFEVNYFDNCIGSKLFGLYETEDDACKRQMVEKLFENRRRGYLLPGDYDYDPEDGEDMLNDRTTVSQILRELDTYHLYQQHTQGGVFLILCGSYELLKN